MPTAPMVAISRRNGMPVEIGEEVLSSRGESGVLTHISRGAIPGKSGKVIVGGREYYDRVWGLRIVSLLACGCHVDEFTDCLHL